MLVRGLRNIVVPDEVAADRRLERASGLSHRPLLVLTDHPVAGGRGPDSAWSAYWVDLIQRGAITQAQAALSILASATIEDGDRLTTMCAGGPGV